MTEQQEAQLDSHVKARQAIVNLMEVHEEDEEVLRLLQRVSKLNEAEIARLRDFYQG